MRQLGRADREAIEQEAMTLPIPNVTLRVAWR